MRIDMDEAERAEVFVGLDLAFDMENLLGESFKKQMEK